MEFEFGELTDEEAATILDVLERDRDLQKREEQRISQLSLNESDPVRLRCLSGSWFTEERNRRHQQCGAELVQSSLRQKKRNRDIPLTSSVFEGQTDIESTDTVPEEEGSQKKEDNSEKNVECHGPPTPRPRTRAPQLKGNEDNNNSGLHNGCKDDASVTESSTEVKSTGNDDDPPPSLHEESDLESIMSLDPIRIGSTSSLQYNTMWNGSVTSLMSVGEMGGVCVSGQLQLSLQHHHTREELMVAIHRCQDLAQARPNHRTNPYVKVYLLPDMSPQSKRKTSVKKKTLNPIYNEIFTYKLADIRGRVLSLSVWHAEALRANVFLGAAEIQLTHWDWDRKQPYWLPLQSRLLVDPALGVTTGTILMSIKFVPAGSEGSGLPPTGELHIWLREAAVVSSKHRVPSTFIKGCVLPDESQSSGQRTRVVRRSSTPIFNHTMVYDGIHQSDLQHICLEMSVWDKQTLSTHCLGGVRFSTGAGVSYEQAVSWMDSSEEEQKVWMAVMNNHNRWVEAALPLRPDLQPCA